LVKGGTNLWLTLPKNPGWFSGHLWWVAVTEASPARPSCSYRRTQACSAARPRTARRPRWPEPRGDLQDSAVTLLDNW